MSKGKVDRRGFIKGAAAAGAGLALGGLIHAQRSSADRSAQDAAAVDRAIQDQKGQSISDLEAQATVEAYMTGGLSRPKVVHVQNADATFWDFGDDYYGDFVDQNVVNNMVDQGVMALTGTSSIVEAWQVLVPGYSPGRAIAIKVNFNNCWWCDKCLTGCQDWELAIDALIHPVNAVVRGLLHAYASLSIDDIWVYDATNANDPRQIPGRFRNGCLYPGVRFFDMGCNETAGYISTDPTALVAWRNPAEIPTPEPTRVTDVLVGASYLINMPIMKKHVGKGVTLSFKNHFGSIDNCANLHDWTGLGSPHYGGTAYSPMVDIYRNAHVHAKTVLTVADALFGNWENNIGKPFPWATFDSKAPNSLLFSTDPVAIDCVMCDFLAAETWMFSGYDDYLVYAASVGLGTYERGDPWGSGYSEIDYMRL